MTGAILLCLASMFAISTSMMGNGKPVPLTRSLELKGGKNSREGSAGHHAKTESALNNWLRKSVENLVAYSCNELISFLPFNRFKCEACIPLCAESAPHPYCFLNDTGRFELEDGRIPATVLDFAAVDGWKDPAEFVSILSKTARISSAMFAHGMVAGSYFFAPYVDSSREFICVDIVHDFSIVKDSSVQLDFRFGRRNCSRHSASQKGYGTMCLMFCRRITILFILCVLFARHGRDKLFVSKSEWYVDSDEVSDLASNPSSFKAFFNDGHESASAICLRKLASDDIPGYGSEDLLAGSVLFTLHPWLTVCKDSLLDHIRLAIKLITSDDKVASKVLYSEGKDFAVDMAVEYLKRMADRLNKSKCDYESRRCGPDEDGICQYISGGAIGSSTPVHREMALPEGVSGDSSADVDDRLSNLANNEQIEVTDMGEAQPDSPTTTETNPNVLPNPVEVPTATQEGDEHAPAKSSEQADAECSRKETGSFTITMLLVVAVVVASAAVICTFYLDSTGKSVR